MVWTSFLNEMKFDLVGLRWHLMSTVKTSFLRTKLLVFISSKIEKS